MYGPGGARGRGDSTPGERGLRRPQEGLPGPGRRPRSPRARSRVSASPLSPRPPRPARLGGASDRAGRRGLAAALPQHPDSGRAPPWAPGTLQPRPPAAPPRPVPSRPRPATSLAEAAPWRAERAPGSRCGGGGGPGVAMVTGSGRRHSRAGPSASAGRGSARLSVGVSCGGAAGPGKRALPGGLSMEDGFSSYSSLYDTSSLLQFCNGEGRRPAGRGPRPRAGRGARPGGRGGRAKLLRRGARFPPPRAHCAGPRAPGRASLRPRPARLPFRLRPVRAGRPIPGRPARAHRPGSAGGGPAAPGLRGRVAFCFQTHICLEMSG